ncbi:hypothetical protein WA158_002135 [Blastocystis sp. Blastoise]
MENYSDAGILLKQQLDRYDKQINDLKSLYDECVGVRERLNTLPDEYTQKVMVPLGPLAFMEGKIVHTNEVLCALGDDYFAWRSSKQAQGILDRRQSHMEKKINTIQEEKAKLLDLQQQINGTSGSSKETEDIHEIVEYIPDEEDTHEEIFSKDTNNHGNNYYYDSNNQKHITVSVNGNQYNNNNKMNDIINKQEIRIDSKSTNKTNQEFNEASQSLDDAFHAARAEGVLDDSHDALVRDHNSEQYIKEKKEELNQQFNHLLNNAEIITENHPETQVKEASSTIVSDTKKSTTATGDEGEIDTIDSNHMCGNCGKKNAHYQCSRCKSAYYCDRDCQLKHWNKHKNICQTIAKQLKYSTPSPKPSIQVKSPAIQVKSPAIKPSSSSSSSSFLKSTITQPNNNNNNNNNKIESKKIVHDPVSSSVKEHPVVNNTITTTTNNNENTKKRVSRFKKNMATNQDSRGNSDVSLNPSVHIASPLGISMNSHPDIQPIIKERTVNNPLQQMEEISTEQPRRISRFRKQLYKTDDDDNDEDEDDYF